MLREDGVAELSKDPKLRRLILVVCKRFRCLEHGHEYESHDVLLCFSFKFWECVNGAYVRWKIVEDV